MDTDKATTDMGSVRTPATDRKSEGDPTVGDTPSADHESADANAGNATSRVTENSSRTSGGRLDDTRAPSGNDRTMNWHFTTWRWKNSCKMRETRKTNLWKSASFCMSKRKQRLKMAPSLP